MSQSCSSFLQNSALFKVKYKSCFSPKIGGWTLTSFRKSYLKCEKSDAKLCIDSKYGVRNTASFRKLEKILKHRGMFSLFVFFSDTRTHDITKLTLNLCSPYRRRYDLEIKNLTTGVRCDEAYKHLGFEIFDFFILSPLTYYM